MDSMVSTTLIIEREIENTRSIRDAGTGSKTKESQSSSSSGKKPNASSSRGFQSRDHQAKVRLGLLVRRDKRFIISAVSLNI